MIPFAAFVWLQVWWLAARPEVNMMTYDSDDFADSKQTQGAGKE